MLLATRFLQQNRGQLLKNRFLSTYILHLKPARWGRLEIKNRKVASSSMSQLVAHFQIFRRLMKEKLAAYVL